jgi:hypothetical protein
MPHGDPPVGVPEEEVPKSAFRADPVVEEAECAGLGRRHIGESPGSGGQASLEAAPTAQPFVGPDQAALEQMLAQVTAGDLQ